MTLHIPNSNEQVIRYYGFYSNKSRGMRKQREHPESIHIIEEEGNEASRRRRKAWARLIAKVYHDDPLICPNCSGRMKIIAFIEEDRVVRKILQHLGLWNDRERSPPPLTTSRQIDLIDPGYSIDSYIRQEPPEDVP